MVNTFLIDSDFSKSAQLLDKKRLGKQRVEAQQILNIILNIKALSNYFNIPLINLRSQNCDPEKSNLDFLKLTIKQIKQQFNLQDYYLILQEDEITIRTSCFSNLYPGDLHIIKLGFCNHPAVFMWFYHTDSLKHYIDCHIEEWIRRGCKNNMKRHHVKNFERPTWTFEDKLLINHRQALINKEIERKEKPWYVNKSIFASAGQFVEYYWPTDGNIKLM